jgi:hypothetical protein
MIQQDDVLDILVGACPSFEVARAEHLIEYGNQVLYVAAGAFANHLLSLQKAGDTACFDDVGATIERLHTDGTPEVKELATIGILEGIQNVWSNSGINSDLFLTHLGQESRSGWQGLDNFWSGKAPYVHSRASALAQAEHQRSAT